MQPSTTSSVLAEPQVATGALSLTARERYGYSVPVIDPSAIVRPSGLALSPQAIGGNLLLAILVSLVLGMSGVLLRRLVVSDGQIVLPLLRRLPFQALITLLLAWLIDAFVPAASAQGFGSAGGVSLLRIPLVAVLFFVVVGASNALLNGALSEWGPVVEGSRLGRLSGRTWFIALVLLGYGLIGAHINPDFSLLPGRQLGIALVAIVTLVLSACIKDAALWGLARAWRMPGRFHANLAGFAVAAGCIALSRTFAISPGYIYGVPIGLLIASRLYEEREGFFEFLGVLWMLVLAFIFWVGGELLAAHPVPFDIANLLFVLLAEDAFFESLPLPGFAGGAIFRWKMWAWFLQAVAVAFLLLHVLFHPQGTVTSLVESPPTLSALLLLGCYASGVLLLWAYVRRRRSVLRGG